MTHTITGQFCGTKKSQSTGITYNVKLGDYTELEFTENNGVLIAPGDWQHQLEKNYNGDWNCFEVIAKQGDNGKWFDVGDYGRSDQVIQLEKETA